MKNTIKVTEIVTAAAKSRQSCPTLSDPMDCSLPGSPVHGIFQARVLEWVGNSHYLNIIMFIADVNSDYCMNFISKDMIMSMLKYFEFNNFKTQYNTK